MADGPSFNPFYYGYTLKDADGKVLEADFTRDMLRNIRVNVANPEEIAAQCGIWL